MTITPIGTNVKAAATGRFVPALVVDDGADELLARDQVRRDVVAEGQREGEDRACDDRRETRAGG